MDRELLKTNLTTSAHWLRLLFMIFFAVVLQVTSLVMWLLVVVQCLFSLCTGSDHLALRKLGAEVSLYIYSTLRFLTYNSEEKPFPFADWPQVDEPTEQV